MNELKMIENKIEFFINVVEKTFLHIKHNKQTHIYMHAKDVSEKNKGNQS